MNTTMAMPINAASKTKKFKGIEIKPIIGSAPPSAGNFDMNEMVIHDGAAQLDSPMFFVEGGLVTYITGLNEDGPEVLDLPEDQQNAKKLEIRRMILRCENELAGNRKVSEKYLEDKEKFYEHVNTFRSVFPAEYTKHSQSKDDILVKRYWDKLDIELRNEGYVLNENDLQDRLRIYGIEAGGYGMIAPSLSVGKDRGQQNFYLSRTQDTARENVSIHMERNKAGTKLEAMYNKDANRLFYVTKMVDINPLSWRTGQNASPNEQMYIACDKFLNGEGRIKTKSGAVAEFNKWANMNMEDLKIHCYVEDGLKLGLLHILTDSTIQFVATGNTLGKGKDNAFAYLKAGGENEPVYIALAKQCENLWKDNN